MIKNWHKIKLPFWLEIITFVVVILTVFSSAVVFIAAATRPERLTTVPPVDQPLWATESIDTMKYSRDRAREALNSPDTYAQIIDQQISNIASSGASHVAIATPYDQEFLPVLTQWVEVARSYGLKIWFRGNWSGWEQWFEYGPIDRAEHIQKTKQFILDNPSLFRNGDLFSGCPECENGGPGDPRFNGDAAGHTQFLINLHNTVTDAFDQINKNVADNMYSMNGDVARLIMTPETTAALGGQVTVDHYVATTDKLAGDLADYAKNSKGTVMLGEFGAPIPDIHGNLTPEQQAAWIADALDKIARVENVSGLNYWTNVDGSTALWNSTGIARPAVEVLTIFFKPKTIGGTVLDERHRPVADALISTEYRTVQTDASGYFALPMVDGYNQTLTISRQGFETTKLAPMDSGIIQIKLKKNRRTPLYTFDVLLRELTDKTTGVDRGR